MLQPALLQPGQIQPAPTSAPAAATYGALVTATRDAVDHALALGAQRLPNAETGANELAGYQRFLRYAGNHLQILMRLAEVRNDHLARLVNRLNAMTEAQPNGGRWLHAAAMLGAAHDLLATHLTGVGIPCTPEGHEILTGPGVARSCVELAELILTAVEGSGELVRRTARAQQGRADKPATARTFARLHASNQAASLHARAALWDLNNQLRGVPPSGLTGLRAAIQLDAAHTSSFATSLAALRLLRYYSHAQARGLSTASPASLRDLALLGARVTNPDAALEQIPAPVTPLGRLERAHLADQLADAHRAWTDASNELIQSVRGLSKAPGGYATVIHQLLDADLTPGLRRAIGTTLPRMGVEAAVVVERLALNADLVTLQRPPLSTRHQWRPIQPEQVAAIADHFTAAGHASRRAFAPLTSTSASPQPAAPPRYRGKDVQLERERQVAR